ncbi:MAG TPA: sigma-70 family RNA polymerase sigma factor [Polyangiaceae bacterium]|nr:sigma-70 family RNA polymerase sigma factor [Polyangiaceae bacterium]
MSSMLFPKPSLASLPDLSSAEPEPEPASAVVPPDETALVAGLIQGSADAWRELETRYGRLILGCISRVLARAGSVRPDDLREVQAILYLELLNRDRHKLRSFSPNRGARFGTWLGLLATNAAHDFLRRGRRHTRCESLDRAEALGSSALDPSELAALRERARRLRDALAELSDKDREFVSLYFGEGLEPEEVAARMQISVKTVYTKKHKLRGRLASLLDGARRAA